MPVPLPIIANAYRVTLNWSGPGGTRAANVMHFLAPTRTALQVAQDIDASVTAAMWNHTGTTSRVDTLEVMKLDGATPTVHFTASGAKWAGPTVAAEIVPAGAAVVTLYTNTRGRRYRGRVYLPFVQENNLANGLIASIVISGMDTAWSNFRAAVATLGSSLAVATYGGPAHTSWTPAATIVTSSTPQAVMGTMRLRQSRLR